MLLGTDELTILRGSKFYGTWVWQNSITGENEDFTGLTATIKIKNIHEDFKDGKNTFEVGVATVEPLDVDTNVFKGRVDIELSKEDTLNFAIPESEEDRYGESDFYSILSITLSTGEVILQAKIRVVESLESETLNFILDNRGEAIIIAGKLDNILLRNDEYIATRDNLIDVVIPTVIQTYNDNHLAKVEEYNLNNSNKTDIFNQNALSKLDAYNLNHDQKLQIINDLAVLVSQDKNAVSANKILVSQDKDAVNLMKQDVQSNTDNVASMKSAIEVMLDTFDDRFLGPFETDPVLDNDGNSLLIGAIYFNSTDYELKFYNGTTWDSPVAAAQTYALQASQSASNANNSKLAAKQSEDNAKLSEQNIEQFIFQNENNYEPKNLNIQSHISNSSNPHGVTANQVGAYSTSESDVKYNQKVNILDIQNTLLSVDINKPLSAYQGKLLKDYIDHINTLLTSNDTNLDELQEIVNFIKQNKSTLDALSIPNIAGLVDALAVKANITGNTLQTFKVAAATSDDEAINKKQLEALISAIISIPTGVVISITGSSAPTGYIKGNGTLLSRTTFANLWAFAQTSGALVSDSEWFNSKQGCYSTGDGSTTFRIPDLRGEFIRGWDNGRGIDTSRVLGSLQEDSYKNHLHTASSSTAGAHTHTINASGINGGISSYIAGAGGSIVTSNSSGAHTHPITVDNSTTGSTETRPRNIALLYCIKY